MFHRALVCALVALTALVVLHPASPAGGDAPSATSVASAASAGWQVGKERRVLGPSVHVDSIYFTTRSRNGLLRGYMSNQTAYSYRQQPDGTLTHERVMLRRGRTGATDQCGVHPAGAIWQRTKAHWIGFYHADEAAPADGDGCAWRGKRTRWSIRRMESFDGGRTWHKRERVVTQDTALLTTDDGGWSYRTDDAGSPRLVVTEDHLYLFYRATNRNSGNRQQMSVARAPLSGLGKAGTWEKRYVGLLGGSFSEPGLGGRQSPVSGLPGPARGISWNVHLGRYLAVIATLDGVKVYASDGTNLLRWHHLRDLVAFEGTTSAWGQPCGKNGLPLAIGYAGIVGTGGSSMSSGRQFWLYYMRKPAGRCFDHRFLVRRLVTLP